MKKILLLMMAIFALLSFNACSSENDPEPTNDQTPQMVTFTVDYSFNQSGTMSRANGEDVYNQFFNEYIATKKISPDNYELRFLMKIDNNQWTTALTTEGKWSSPQFITLPEGVYRVIGTSKDSNYGHDDKLYLTFEDTLDISLKTEKIVINAKYNNALILFNAEGIEGIEYDSPKTSGVDATPTVCLPFTKLGNVYYHCINNIFTGGSGDRLIINTGAEDDIFLYLIKNTYKPGYYYYFEKIDGNYILPPFKEGN